MPMSRRRGRHAEALSARVSPQGVGSREDREARDQPIAVPRLVGAIENTGWLSGLPPILPKNRALP
jgi:hypothetical protein